MVSREGRMGRVDSPPKQCLGWVYLHCNLIWTLFIEKIRSKDPTPLCSVRGRNKLTHKGCWGSLVPPSTYPSFVKASLHGAYEEQSPQRYSPWNSPPRCSRRVIGLLTSLWCMHVHTNSLNSSGVPPPCSSKRSKRNIQHILLIFKWSSQMIWKILQCIYLKRGHGRNKKKYFSCATLSGSGWTKKMGQKSNTIPKLKKKTNTKIPKLSPWFSTGDGFPHPPSVKPQSKMIRNGREMVWSVRK